MEEREILVAACDLDKTLYPPEGPAQAPQLKANVEAMVKFENTGCFVFPVTGNNLSLAQKKFMDPQNPTTQLRDVAKHPGIFTNGGLVLGPGGMDNIIEKHALGKLILNEHSDKLDFVTALLVFVDEEFRESSLKDVGLAVLTPHLIVGYSSAYSNVDGYAAMMHVEATKLDRQQIIEMRDEALQIVFLWPPLTSKTAEEQKREYDQVVRPMQESVVARMQEKGLMNCSYPLGQTVAGVGVGLKTTAMKDPWPEVDINVAGVDKGKALCRFLQNRSVLDLLRRDAIDVTKHVAVFGDAGNDVPMFEAIGDKQAGIRVAMPHSDHPVLRELATRTAQVNVVLEEIVQAKLASPDELLRLRISKVDRKQAGVENTLQKMDIDINRFEQDYREKNGKVTINFRPVKMCDPKSLGKTVHFKGFGQRIDFADGETSAWAECTLGEMASLAPQTVVWDGDSYSEDSFTSLLPQIHQACKCRLVMFLRDTDKDKERVLKSWSFVSFGPRQNIDCFLVDSDIHFEELGKLALEATRSSQVVAFGGGVVVEKEFAATPASVSYSMAAAKRKSSDGKSLEPCALELKQAPNLKHLKIKA